MAKYDKMVKKNQETNKAKEQMALKAIQQMLRNGTPVSVLELTKRTNLSKSLFYKNPRVRAELKAAEEAQKGDSRINARSQAINKAMQLEMTRLKNKNDALKEEITKLKEKLDRKEEAEKVMKEVRYESLF